MYDFKVIILMNSYAKFVNNLQFIDHFHPYKLTNIRNIKIICTWNNSTWYVI